MKRNHYDPHDLMARAAEWLVEAESATRGAIRALCITEAERCVQIAQRSLFTPVLLEPPDAVGKPSAQLKS
jgi:hypothetical protein